MREWRSMLAEKYQGVLRCAYPEVEDGWRDLVERALGRIVAAVEGCPINSLAIVQIKQKFGGLRIYWDAGSLPDDVAAQVEEAVELAEARSYVTCEMCGREGRLHDDGGWLTTRCEAHSRGAPAPDRGIVEKYAVIEGGEWHLVSRRRYDRARDCFVDIGDES